MITERYYIWEDRKDVYLDAYIAEDLSPEVVRPAMLVIPGGGYHFIADREAEPIADIYLAAGFNCFCLTYSVGEAIKSPRSGNPLPLIEASRAVALIKRNAEKFHIDKDRVSAVGFSAGGHLAGSLATMWHYDFVREEAEIEYGENRLYSAILAYPVITSEKDTHVGSFRNLLSDESMPKDRADFYSIEKQVSDKTVPCFIWHTATDPCVPIKGTLLMALALAKHGIPNEIHVYGEGPHGLGDCLPCNGCDDKPFAKRASVWKDASVKWLNSLEMIRNQKTPNF